MEKSPAIRGMTRILQQKWRPLLLAFMLYAVPVIIFAAIANEILEREPLPADNAVLQLVHRLETSWLDAVIPVVTNIGGTIGIVVLTIAAAVLLISRQRRREVSFLLAGVGGGVLLNLILKGLFQRDRPQLWQRLVTENSYSFPSGHAMASSALALSVVLICWPTRYRWWAVAGAAVYMVGVAFTRLYLGVHYPSDILAGWAASLAWVLAAGHILLRRRS